MTPKPETDNQTEKDSGLHAPTCSASSSWEPEPMVIIEGRIKMEGNITSFGYPLWNYLRHWQKEKSIPDGTRIRVITDEAYQDLIARSRMAGIA